MPAEVHHRRAGTGGGTKASDFDTMPLCYPHHRDHPGAFHVLGTKAFPKFYGITEAELVIDTWERLGFTEDQISEWREEFKNKKNRKKNKKKTSLVKPNEEVKDRVVAKVKISSIKTAGTEAPKPIKAKIRSGSSFSKKPDIKYTWASRKLVSAGTIKSRPFQKQSSNFK